MGQIVIADMDLRRIMVRRWMNNLVMNGKRCIKDEYGGMQSWAAWAP